MMNHKRFLYGASMLVGIIVYLCLGSVLPRFESNLFASPDETAVAIFAEQYLESGDMRIGIPFADELKHLSGLHPRSMVQQGAWMVPVGFLGMPFLIALIERIVPGMSVFATLILVLSSAYPLWMLIRRKGGSIWISASATLVYLFSPTVLLYVNRGFFPNLPVIALTLWGLYLLDTILRIEKRDWKTILFSILSGIAFGFAFAIRPIEVLWILPWMIWVGSDHRFQISNYRLQICNLKSVICNLLPGFIAGIVILFFAGNIAVKTYPYHDSWFKQPVFGYELHDMPAERLAETFTGLPSPEYQIDLSTYLPFGFHPRQMLTNIRLYFMQYLALWFWPALVGACLMLWRFRSKMARWGFVVSAWTAGILLLFYGQAAYTDNINGSVALGNSFLRYLLPLIPLMGIAIGYLIETIAKDKMIGKIIGMLAIVLMVCMGIWVGFQKDEEGVLATMRSLDQYRAERTLADYFVKEPSIILSERSDKIFASSDHLVISPLPNAETLEAMISSSIPMYFFHRISKSLDDFPEVMRPYLSHEDIAEPLFTYGNEGMYRVSGEERVESGE